MNINDSIKKEFGQDYVLVLEKSTASLKVDRNNNDYILEGIAAVFGQENNNNRIYEEKEYLPHLDYLQKKIEKKKLLGELDHPANFETSLKNASHVVEKLEYDQANRSVKIRVRLINGHPAGEMAKALVEAGVPLSISSRAAGVVKENKKVQIKKIFTYDLVADPGFEQAQLDRIYESVLTKYSEDEKPTILRKLKDISSDFFDNYDGTKIYKIEEGNSDFLRAIDTQEKNTPFEMTNGKFVTVDEMNEYSRIIKTEMDKLKEKLKDAPEATEGVNVLESRIARIETYMKYLAENVDKNIQYSEYLAENMDKNIEYSKYLAENLDKTITYSEYLAENLDKNISYSEYLAENLDKNISYSEYLAENLDKSINYSEYLAENVDKSISYANYLAENLEKGICYSEYLAENLDKSISYSEYLAENVDRNIAYSEYLAESIDKGISYSEYLAEKIEKNIAYSEYIAENVNIAPSTEAVPANTKKVNEQTEKTDYSALSSKINTLLESVTKQKAASTLNESKYAFYKILDEESRKEFNALDETKKEKVVSALQTNAWFTKSDVHRVWESALVEKEVDDEPLFIKNMPDNVKPIWESMTPVEKESIYAQATAHKLNTAYQIKHFWSTRNLKKENVGLIKLNENQSAEPGKPSKVGYGNDYMSKVAEGLGKRFKK